jgi:lysophospholipase L1-like esterase
LLASGPVRLVRWAAAAAAIGGAVPVLELLLFRRYGASPVPGPYQLDGIVGGVGGGSIRLVWLGDSLSAGVGADDAEESLPRHAASLVASQLGCRVELVCLAVPGASAADVLAGQVPLALGQLTAGAVAIVLVGCNDILRLVRPGPFRASYAQIVEALGATGATVVTVGLPNLAAMIVAMPQPLRSMAGLASRRANRIISEVARQTGALHVSISDDGPSRQRMLSLLSSDRFHPNGAGYQIWADLVAGRLLGLPFVRAMANGKLPVAPFGAHRRSTGPFPGSG